MRQTALVTGGAGFLGSHLVEKLVNEKFDVIVVDNFSTAWPSNEGFLVAQWPAVQLVKADVCLDWEPWLAKIPPHMLDNLKYIFHFASPASPKSFSDRSIEIMKVNSIGLERALNFADRNDARLVFASTSEVYGDAMESPQLESYWGNVNSYGPRACYDESKRFGEALIYSWNKTYQTNHGLVRIFNTYGPRMHLQDGRVINNLLLQAINGEVLTVYGSGLQTRCFCYVDDLIDGIYKYAGHNITEPVNIGHPSEITILQLTEIIKEIFFKKKLQVIFKDLPENDPIKRRPDINKALNLLKPWEPRVSLKEGLIRTITWLESANAIVRKS